jgi:hypothetical protein
MRKGLQIFSIPTIIFYRQKQERLKEALSQRLLPLPSEETQTGYQGSRPEARKNTEPNFPKLGEGPPGELKTWRFYNG